MYCTCSKERPKFATPLLYRWNMMRVTSEGKVVFISSQVAGRQYSCRCHQHQSHSCWCRLRQTKFLLSLVERSEAGAQNSVVTVPQCWRAVAQGWATPQCLCLVLEGAYISADAWMPSLHMAREAS